MHAAHNLSKDTNTYEAKRSLHEEEKEKKNLRNCVLSRLDMYPKMKEF